MIELTPEQYVNIYGPYFEQAAKADIDHIDIEEVKRLLDEEQYAVQAIRYGIRFELKNAINALPKDRTNKDIDDIIVTYNRKWNNIADILTSRTGEPFLRYDMILNAWLETIEKTYEEGFV